MVGQNGFQRNGQARRPRLLQQTAEAWPSLDLYGRFEQSVALVLTIVVSGVIVVAVLHLVLTEVRDLFFRPLGTVEHASFQTIFGMIMTVLIAMEFNHTIVSIFQRKGSIVQLRTVILIALLAMVRKFIIIDATSLDPLTVIAVAIAVLVLGTVYWMVREQDRRRALDRAESNGA